MFTLSHFVIYLSWILFKNKFFFVYACEQSGWWSLQSRKVYNPFRKIPPPTLPLTSVDLVFGKPLPWPTPSPRSLLFGRLVPCQVLATHISWNPCHARSNEWPESLVFDTYCICWNISISNKFVVNLEGKILQDILQNYPVQGKVSKKKSSLFF